MSRLRSHRREPPGPALTDENAAGFADCVLAIAAETDEAERRIWLELERLADLGDVAAIRALLARRRELSPVELAATLGSRGPRAA